LFFHAEARASHHPRAASSVSHAVRFQGTIAAPGPGCADRETVLHSNGHLDELRAQAAISERQLRLAV
jgi:hypothetical protein